jgi:hypothetical protein
MTKDQRPPRGFLWDIIQPGRVALRPKKADPRHLQFLAQPLVQKKKGK